MNPDLFNNNFSDFNLNQKILKAIKEINFYNPTPIQKKVIPQFKSSKQDIIASAQTGTGKTAAFGLPLIDLVRIKMVTFRLLFYVQQGSYVYK